MNECIYVVWVYIILLRADGFNNGTLSISDGDMLAVLYLPSILAYHLGCKTDILIVSTCYYKLVLHASEAGWREIHSRSEQP